MNQLSRFALILATAVSAAALMGCPPMPPKPSTQPAANSANMTGLSEAPSIGFEPVAKGVYVAVARTPMNAEELARAKTPRDQVRKVIEQNLPATTEPATQPSTQPSAAPATQPVASATTQPDAEPPPLAVKYYLEGREHFLDGANSDAMASLEKALQLDPQAFTVLRLMGRVCFAGSQLARGAMYLHRAHALHPTDVEVNYLLGRYWLERADNERAADFLIQAQESPERQITSTQTPLSSFYLAIALQQAGFNRAAGQEFEHFLEVSQLPVAGYRYDAELGYLINMEWSTHLAAAENYARAGDFKTALGHYKTAAEARPDDAFIASRLVNALVHQGQGGVARRTALGLLTSTRGSDDSVKLVEWTFTATGEKAALIGDITAFLKAPQKNEALQETDAITLASALDYLGRTSDAFATLNAFCQAHPSRLQALGQLLKRVDSTDTFGKALRATARAIAADPKLADDVLPLFSPVAAGPVGASYLKAKPATTGDYAQLYLLALTRRVHGESPESVEQMLRESVRNSPPEFFTAREELITQLLGEEKFTEADPLIQQLIAAPGADEKALKLRIDSEATQQRLVSAMKLALDAKTRFPRSAEIRRMLVSVYRLRGMDSQADGELQAMVRDLPKEELGYRLLTSALFTSGRRAGTQEAATTAVIALTNKLLEQIPDSRFARITAAIVYARQSRYDDAQTILQSLLAADPDDADVLIPLAQIRQLAGKKDAADLLEASLKRKPNVDTARSLAGIYHDLDRKPDALALTKRLADENPDNESLALLYVSELIAQDKTPDAITYLVDLQKRFPHSQGIAITLARVKDDAGDRAGAIQSMQAFMKANGESTDRLYLLSHFYTEAGNDDASVAALQRVLAIMPDNIGANNDLGYFWANAGVHLEQAEPMIRKAMENKPDDPAFVDSLGWLYYKEGKIDQAATLLQKAVGLPGGSEPEVIRHLGDALYRLNRTPEAIEQWAEALQRLSFSDTLDKADRNQRDYLNSVLSEARAGRPAPVSPLATPDTAKAAGSTTAPATGPQ